jgi:hypothetical protein
MLTGSVGAEQTDRTLGCPRDVDTLAIWAIGKKRREKENRKEHGEMMSFVWMDWWMKNEMGTEERAWIIYTE